VIARAARAAGFEPRAVPFDREAPAAVPRAA
jgi:hypothetical protein